MQEKLLQTFCRIIDLVIEPLVVVQRGSELLAQVVIVGSQPVAQRGELSNLFFEDFQFRIHGDTIVSKNESSQHLTWLSECCLPP